MRGTLQQYRDFIQSGVWMDLKEMLLLRRSAIRDLLEDGSPAVGGKDDQIFWEERQRGRSEELRFLVDYPQYIVDNYDTLKVTEEETDG